MTLRDDAIIWPALNRLADCLCAELTAAGGPELCFCGIQGGEAVMIDYPFVDDCGGMAWVRLSTAFPSVQQFPSPDATGTCATILGYTVEAGVLRRGPTLDDDGNPPDSSEWADGVRIQMSDMAAVRRAVSCCFVGRDTNYVLQSWLPVYTGDVMGGAWTVTIQQEV